MSSSHEEENFRRIILHRTAAMVCDIMWQTTWERLIQASTSTEQESLRKEEGVQRFLHSSIFLRNFLIKGKYATFMNRYEAVTVKYPMVVLWIGLYWWVGDLASRAANLQYILWFICTRQCQESSTSCFTRTGHEVSAKDRRKRWRL